MNQPSEPTSVIPPAMESTPQLSDAPRVSQFDRITEALDENRSQTDEQLGLDAKTVALALHEATRDCPGSERCHLDSKQRDTVTRLIKAAGKRGDMASAASLLQLRRFGFYMAGRALEKILAREAAKTTAACEPPPTRDVHSARADLSDFVVIDRRGDDWTARKPTDRELDDLAYFFAAVSESGPPIGDSDDIVASLVAAPPKSLQRDTTSHTQAASRKDHLYGLSDALEVGDLQRAQQHAVGYLETLGYPDRIDARLEKDRTWGGPRFAYVMRDLALVSEVVGEVEIAAELYRRAKPGGGACGTSVDSRRGKQLRGLIRSAERSGNCRRVVAERLLDWEHDFRDDDEPTVSRYGPARLAEAGWDVARLYRGALLTRNRDGDSNAIEAALRTLPSSVARDAQSRFDERGPEAWEFRVRAAEGLADTSGRDALADLVALLPVGSQDLQRRVIEAIGALGSRNWSGPCPTDELGTISLGSISSSWSRQVAALGTTCQTQLDDATAASLARTLAPYVDPQRPLVAAAALETLGALAAPASRSDFRRWRNNTARDAKAACDGVDTWSEACQDATNLHDAATSSWERWRDVVESESDPD